MESQPSSGAVPAHPPLGERARSLYGSPLSKPRVARLAIIILALLIEASAGVLVKFNFTRLPPGARGIFLTALLIAVLLSLIPLAILWYLDRRERESVWLYLVMLLWGGLIATAIASPISQLLLPEGSSSFLLLQQDPPSLFNRAAELPFALLSLPSIEEITKGLGVLVAFWLLRAEFDSVRDGFIYGALVGIGFNILDSAFFVANSFAATGNPSWLPFLVLYHSLFGLGGHALYTGFFGMGLGLARQTTHVWLRFAAPVAGWFAGFGAHLIGSLMGILTLLLAGVARGGPLPLDAGAAGSDLSRPAFWAMLASGSYISIFWAFPFLCFAALLLWQSGVWERSVIRDELRDEDARVITPEEYEGVVRDRVFRTRRIHGHASDRARAIIRAQNELAIRKWRVRHMGGSPATDPVVLSWRHELERLRL